MPNHSRPVPSLLYLLQLASPSLPVGAYSYSEGLETLVFNGIINNQENLRNWLENQLKYGAINLEAALMLRAYQSIAHQNLATLTSWNNWASAAKETKELRQQSWQMGQSLLKLLMDCEPELKTVASAMNLPCNYAVAFGIGAAYWQIEPRATIMGYLHSWTANLISAGVKLIPLGQTAGQQILLGLQNIIIETTEEILTLKDEELQSCGWGLALASMSHENQYTRLFRS
ncbi:MAG: urease accessory protein UreF [Gomphosphaeria aponina SAG 52.96 = DSM 107014]|uniref:Urease accessory protein UreF n=1 Tax=Gomphosphaeria aponina SAG 52.96 = DSM 107014 TaxID=1521640 RepID=A0A941JTM6_9CHRO|nr:urease accessory protein UreF [Gomphosphaeria aponina SAG 52.96 = DSM 107014]